ncbi:MAG: U32 family peptidase [Clostridia bacterium]|nr:U32 family peptidase [Clostridia bacterium]
MPERYPLPELLAPAGSPAALRAAIAAGADAVYFGGGSFNARMRAKNFTDEDVADAIALCHAYGVKVYMTFNTLVTDRELPLFLEAAHKAYTAGVDALIVADLGAAELLHRLLPALPLHASTQCSIHNSDGAREMARRGFCRVVPARELSRENIADMVQKSGTEVEIFIHGALCVSHSGQCLFSSLVGGRSGNRGECAQPCRLPDAKGRYPLSLKDLCLARKIPFLIEAGVHSLKIEGRLKSPSYVYQVVSIYRRLLDERRAATDAEVAALAAAFSRSGFTDGYFSGRINHRMMGVRTEADKQTVCELDEALLQPSPIPLDISFEMCAKTPIRLTVSDAKRTVTLTGDAPLEALNAPMDGEAVKKNLCRLGGTPYTVGTVAITVGPGLMVPVSRLNALRREALRRLTAPDRPQVELVNLAAPRLDKGQSAALSARFTAAAQITPLAQEQFPLRYLPLHAFDGAVANGVEIPPVILEDEREAALAALREAQRRGAKHALIGNVGHLILATEAGLIPHGDFRLNLTNSASLSSVLSQGFADALLSAELTLPQIRDIGGRRDAIVYGRVPLMLLEKCAGREVGDCATCKAGQAALVDRRGERFPIRCLPTQYGERHRNILYNSRPTVMSDRRRELLGAGISKGHFIFSVESAAEVDRVIRAYQKGLSLGDKVRRI